MISIQRYFSNSSKLCQLGDVCRRTFSSKTSPPKSEPATSKGVKQDPSKSEISVSGLSSKVLNVPASEVGPGASKSGSYKNPEYFSYHVTSYFDAELEMEKYRLPQPSAK